MDFYNVYYMDFKIEFYGHLNCVKGSQPPIK